MRGLETLLILVLLPTSRMSCSSGDKTGCARCQDLKVFLQTTGGYVRGPETRLLSFNDASSGQKKRGFPKIRGPFVVVLIIRALLFWGPY